MSIRNEKHIIWSRTPSFDTIPVHHSTELPRENVICVGGIEGGIEGGISVNAKSNIYHFDFEGFHRILGFLFCQKSTDSQYLNGEPIP
jgi:hypothetical protein